MSKIVGFKVVENQPWENTDEKTGQVRSGVINRVTFKCLTRFVGEPNEVCGDDVKTVMVNISDLPSAFGRARNAGESTYQYCQSLMNRDCAIETAAKIFEGKISGETVKTCYFFDQFAQPAPEAKK